MNYFLLLTNFIRLVALVPLNPLGPHFINFIFLELSSNAKSSNCIDVGIELTPLFQMSKFLIKYLHDLFLLGFHLSQLAICYIQGIITLHYYTNYNLNYVELYLIRFFIIFINPSEIFWEDMIIKYRLKRNLKIQYNGLIKNEIFTLN